MVRLFEAQVMHARLWPRPHRFTHSVFCFSIPLQEWDSIGQGLWLLGQDGWAPYQLRQQDFLPREKLFQPEGLKQDFGKPGDSLAERVHAFCRSQGESLPDQAEITLVAMPRAFGKSYNPVVFFLITLNQELHCGIAEVHNTFGERKAWFLGRECLETNAAGEKILRLRTPKHFYVSPFSGLETEFEFCLRQPQERLALAVDHYENGQKTLISTWTGRTAPLTDGRLFWLTCKIPFLILKVIALIHFHAAWLWLIKRLPFRRKRQDVGLQRNLRNPTTDLEPKND